MEDAQIKSTALPSQKRKIEGSMNQMFMDGNQSYVLIPEKE
jgi:hypothetical protein